MVILLYLGEYIINRRLDRIRFTLTYKLSTSNNYGES